MTGAERIAAERKRQVELEGWTAEHDDRHGRGELKHAALAYLYWLHRDHWRSYDEWPWDPGLFRPDPTETRNLEKAGALIAAEIDRLRRLKEKNA